jgi:hypothetical protein
MHSPFGNYNKAALISKTLALSTLFSLAVGVGIARADGPFRPPAVPLVTFDPYLSVWSENDKLTDGPTRHWTHREHPLVSLIRIDGKSYRLMGNDPGDVTAFPQVSVKVMPTHTIYEFENDQVHVTLTFLTPALPNDLDAFSLPLSYLTWQVRSIDGKSHAVSLYDSTSGLLAVNEPNEPVEWGRGATGGLTELHIGTHAQPILGSSGDDHRINWGYAYAAASRQQSKSVIGADNALLRAFIATGEVPSVDDARAPRPADQDQPVLAFSFNLGDVTDKLVTRQVIVAYDEIDAIKYFGKALRPFWRRNGISAEDMLVKASRDFTRLDKRCTEFDGKLVNDATVMGGERYAQIVALSYRECAAGNGLAADANQQPLYFTKENTSDGDIATVDVFFPMGPQWVLLSPTLMKATLVPLLAYADSAHWKFPNAPHDLGTYPVARGTDDGGEGMPVEESGNMLILCDAVSQEDGNTKFVDQWWPKLTQWAKYLEQYGLDPEDQLCTDDFMGHLAHNANLSVKAILALAAYGDMCRLKGDTANAERYASMAKVDATNWVKVADDGDHYRLAFNQPNTWSQKYNLVWDRILGLNVFPPEVATKEVAYYKTRLLQYGLPLDSRTHLSKTDWSFWSASLSDSRSDFEAIVSPAYDYLNATTTRDPVADSYETDKIESGGMHARPVVGGLFVKMLTDRATWLKWANMDKTQVGPWAPLPKPPVVTPIVPTSQELPQNWKYTVQKPADGWTAVDFDTTFWKEGPAGFGTDGTPGIIVHTRWDTDDIWLRREITLPTTAFDPATLRFYVYHDEDIEVYVNGNLASSEGGFVASYTPLEIAPPAVALLKPGATVMIAVHCHQTTGGQGVDVGLSTVVEAPQ